jgi:hypothetical protein
MSSQSILDQFFKNTCPIFYRVSGNINRTLFPFLKFSKPGCGLCTKAAYIQGVVFSLFFKHRLKMKGK